ncbi:uncharacterized protein LOC120164775 [Hibiscus syriacus]|uniref:uncharacterized protein LOC120164775 n=1 Tax=Hibiscus syriacus TaxID=106335 RepID=UPI001924C6A8|nr:uncharacterized protein LOC120164775 [Hibiscus syriacus]
MMNSSSTEGSLISSVSLNGSVGHSLRSPVVLDPCRLSNVGPPPPGSAVVPSIGRKRHSSAGTLTDYSFLLDDDSSSSAESPRMEEDNDETRRLKIELKHTMDMYHAACKEALNAKQQVMELQEWKRKQERRLRASSPSLATVDDTTRKVVEKEVQKRVALVRRKLLYELGQCQYQAHLVEKYRGLFHILVVIFLYYFYFTMFIPVRKCYPSQDYT